MNKLKSLILISAAMLLIGFQPANAGGLQDQAQGQGQGQGQLQGQLQGQKQGQGQGQAQGQIGINKNYNDSKAIAAQGQLQGNVGNDTDFTQNYAAAKIPKPAAMAPNPSAAPPSASCWIGASVTAAVSEFGIGVSGMEWDPICGLWLAAQQVAGEPQKEAATAAFCMTMDKANVQSVACVDWSKDQTLMENLVSLDPDNRANVDASITGSQWGR